MTRADLIAALEKLDGPFTTPLYRSQQRRDLITLAERAGLTGRELDALDEALGGSIDAALSLVPFGFTWLIASGATKRNVRPWAHIDGPECGFASEAATTAIALCIAALKARE